MTPSLPARVGRRGAVPRAGRRSGGWAPDGTISTPSLPGVRQMAVTFAPDGTMYYVDGSPYNATSTIYAVPPGGSATAVYSTTRSRGRAR